ncbi:MAG: FAD/NAD(P)-binding domain-containing protein [Aureobasidium pullulans]|uniref:GroES-like protein n=1 Tax=Aureobasidium pullulans TaxID=5580 RepID=A0A1A7MJW6_AURPU|nr:MAG: FAD/NAD(P)-binding domain-containing protein [Aureobasidium pullulans]THW20939.1 GroES-like protein [Aureobasidium pullulans]THW78135.1 GroES-like protein [Aureobasidium pullulans]THY66076.1 GroES-like protein [Aureobasidium pullulans]THZ28979.1 GroES-like protein [Aureobasidium pullulans]
MASAVKAWTFTHEGYPHAIHKSALPAPFRPSATELHVRVKAAALNPVDIQLMNLPIWKYLPKFFAPLEKGIAEDFSGIVESAGKDSGYEVGDEVFGITFTLTGGTLQNVAIVNTKSSIVVKKPQDMSWEQAAALPLVWLTARTAISNVELFIQSNSRLAVLGGSSGVGMYVLQLAAQRGWEVLSTCSSRNAEFVKSMGATRVVDYNTSDVTQAVGEFEPSAIIDCVGGTSCIGLANRYVTIVGDKTGRDSMGGAATYLWNPQMVVRTLLGKIGVGKSYACVNLKFQKEWLEETLSLDREKIIIDSTWEFDQAKEAFAKLNTGRATGKVIVRVG